MSGFVSFVSSGPGDPELLTLKAVNRLQEIGGGWVLVHRGEIVGEVRYEIGGLMTARGASASSPHASRAARPWRWRVATS